MVHPFVAPLRRVSKTQRMRVCVCLLMHLAQWIANRARAQKGTNEPGRMILAANPPAVFQQPSPHAIPAVLPLASTDSAPTAASMALPACSDRGSHLIGFKFDYERVLEVMATATHSKAPSII